MARQSPAEGRDSPWKAVRRNLSLARMGELWRRGAAVVRQSGWQALWREISFRVRLALHREVWRHRADIPLRRELRAQRRRPPEGAPQVSVVVPLYNTPPKYLKAMLRSVLRQSYARFELVLADGSDANRPDVQRICARAAARDGRVVLLRLAGNGGIAANTNAAIAAASGGWLALLDHDDVLWPNALYELVCAAQGGADMAYSDEVVLSEDLRHLCEYHFKGDYGPDTLRGVNMITHLCGFSRRLLERAGGSLSGGYDGAQDYDLVLRLSEKAQVIRHIPRVLYAWRRHGGSTAAHIGQKPRAAAAGCAAVQAHLRRAGLAGDAESLARHPGAVRVRYQIAGEPMVSVLIPSCDHADDLARCLAALNGRGGWDNTEVLVIDNNSREAATEEFYEKALRVYKNLSVLRYGGEFNFSAINNFAARRARGAHLLLLNNDVEVSSEGFVRELLSYSARGDVGAVGAMLYYPDGTVQHAGLIVGIGGTAGVSHKGHRMGNGGDMYRLATAQNVSAVTGAALMVKREAYLEAGGLDERDFAVAFNDVDFCLRLRGKGLWNVFTPFAEAVHFESKSRGYDTEGEKRLRFEREAAAFRRKWAGVLERGDPFYNPHFTLKTENFAYK